MGPMFGPWTVVSGMSLSKKPWKVGKKTTTNTGEISVMLCLRVYSVHSEPKTVASQCIFVQSLYCPLLTLMRTCGTTIVLSTSGVKGHPSAGEVANNVGHIWCRHNTQICHVYMHLKTNGSCGKFVPDVPTDGRFLLLSVTSYMHEAISVSWWRHDMENFSASLALLHWKRLVTGGFFWKRASNSEVDGFLSSEHFFPAISRRWIEMPWP